MFQMESAICEFRRKILKKWPTKCAPTNETKTLFGMAVVFGSVLFVLHISKFTLTIKSPTLFHSRNRQKKQLNWFSFDTLTVGNSANVEKKPTIALPSDGQTMKTISNKATSLASHKFAQWQINSDHNIQFLSNFFGEYTHNKRYGQKAAATTAHVFVMFTSLWSWSRWSHSIIFLFLKKCVSIGFSLMNLNHKIPLIFRWLFWISINQYWHHSHGWAHGIIGTKKFHKRNRWIGFHFEMNSFCAILH